MTVPGYATEVLVDAEGKAHPGRGELELLAAGRPQAVEGRRRH